MGDVKTVSLKFLIGEKHVFSIPLCVIVRNGTLSDSLQDETALITDVAEMDEKIDGLLFNLMPIEKNINKIKRFRGIIRYAPRQYKRYYIDFGVAKEDYLAQFSSKSRSTMNRKAKNFARLDNGSIDLKEYRQVSDMDEFFSLARVVSQKTYQEKLLNAGLPSNSKFLLKAKKLAEQDKVRAYILSTNKKPVAYLFCPAENDTLIYAYLGYDPDFAKFSPGTVLHWIVFQQLFDQGDFTYFDFTQGEGSHKENFATHFKTCCDAYYLKNTSWTHAKILMHAGWENFFETILKFVEQLGLKQSLKKLFRKGA